MKVSSPYGPEKIESFGITIMVEFCDIIQDILQGVIGQIKCRESRRRYRMDLKYPAKIVSNKLISGIWE
jgi:hypothetical protein